MNTNKEVIYTMIGGMMFKNVPDWANKIKVLSNGAIFALGENKQCQIFDSRDSFILGATDKYDFISFDIPLLAPKFALVGHDLHKIPEKGGMIENGKTYIVGEQGLPAEAIQFYGRGNRVKPANAETPDKKKGVNILTLTFDSGSKLSDVLNMVESEISNAGINVVDDISSICVNSLTDDISNMLKDKMYVVSQKLATHIYEEEYDSVSVTLMMNELRTLEGCLRKLKKGSKADIRLNVIS